MSTTTVPNGVSAGTLPVGSSAPAFSGRDVLTGKTIDASTLKGQNVLYFFSSGTTCQACMVQAQALQQDSSLFAKAHMTLVMVTNDNASALVAGAQPTNSPSRWSPTRRAVSPRALALSAVG